MSSIATIENIMFVEFEIKMQARVDIIRTIFAQILNFSYNPILRIRRRKKNSEQLFALCKTKFLIEDRMCTYPNWQVSSISVLLT